MIIHQNILKRKQIYSQFDYIFDYPLTVVVAAMGYGKSTAILDYLNGMNAEFTYLTVENNELLPQYIWDSLARQLIKTNPELGKQLRELGFPADFPQIDKIIRILEDHVFHKKMVLVIDDYHFCHSSEFDRLIEKIVRNKIEGFHIILLSRIVPELNVEELVLKGFCYQIRSELFELTQDEIKEFFRLYGNRISDDTAKQVLEVSEGWVSAIYLIMKRYTEIGRVESGRSLDRLIETGVMWRYSDKEVRILKSLCILDNFSSRQAVYMTGDPATERIIQKMSYENSFIRYDEQACVYRIHNIFSNFLKKIMLDDPDGLVIEDLYKRAGEWFIKDGDILSGLNYFLIAKEYDLILIEFEKQSINKIIDRNSRYIIELFEHIPIEIKYRYPIGYIAYIGFYVTNVDRVEGARMLMEAELWYQNMNEFTPQMKEQIFGEIELIRAYIQFNHVTLMHERFKVAYKKLNGRSLIANKDKIITFGSPHVVYLYYREKGKLFWTIEQLEALFPYYNKMAGGCGAGFEYLIRAEYCIETGDLEGAKRYANKAIYKAKTLEQTSIIICAEFILSRVNVANGNFEEAYEIMDDLYVEVELCNSPILSSAYDLCAGYIGGITDNQIYYPKWLRHGNIKESEVLYQGMGFNYIVYGKYLLQDKEYLKLEVMCEEMKQIFCVYDNQLGYLHMYLLSAVAKFRLYGFKEAIESILLAIDIGRRDMLIWPIVEYGKHLIDILKELQITTLRDEYISKLVEYTSDYIMKLEKKDAFNLPLPSLTNREKEILKLIVEGKINRMIASELYIAEVTVRKNITSIYRKLNVNGRASAVKKAVELNLIS